MMEHVRFIIGKVETRERERERERVIEGGGGILKVGRSDGDLMDPERSRRPD